MDQVDEFDFSALADDDQNVGQVDEFDFSALADDDQNMDQVDEFDFSALTDDDQNMGQVDEFDFSALADDDQNVDQVDEFDFSALADDDQNLGQVDEFYFSAFTDDDQNVDQVDEFYFSALTDDDQLLPISDQKYADELQLQEVPIKNTIKKEQGSSSSSSSTIKIKTEPLFCKICMETSPTSFLNKNCSHTFCNDCLRRYISTKLKENVSAIECPEENCKAIIEPENCQGFVPKEVFERWGNVLCEAMILGDKKYSYCPFKDCSALLLNDDNGNVTQSECPNCRRLFCAKCEVVWHAGLSCQEVKSLGVKDREVEDFRLIETAKSNKWMKCPQCKFYVEKIQGCLHITCRCRCEFCYGCGKKWDDPHASCTV